MVQMPPREKDEFWSLMLVRVEANLVTACANAAATLAVPAQYGGWGWYIKRIEILLPPNPDLYRLSIAIKAGTEKAMQDAVNRISAAIRQVAPNAQIDVYPVSEIRYMANW